MAVVGLLAQFSDENDCVLSILTRRKLDGPTDIGEAALSTAAESRCRCDEAVLS